MQAFYSGWRTWKHLQEFVDWEVRCNGNHQEVGGKYEPPHFR
jgi:hypothetical protein